MAAAATDRYVGTHAEYTVTQLWRNYSYHRVFDLVSHFHPTRDPASLQALSLGPRTEIELYYLRFFFGFRWENLTGVDVVSTASKIRLADMSRRLPFCDDSFDVIVASHCLEKSRDARTTRDEIRRIAKPGAWILVSGDRLPEGASLYQEQPIPCRYFGRGVYGFIDFYGIAMGDIEYMNAVSPHGFEIIFRLMK